MTEWQYLRNPRSKEHHRILLIDGGRLSEERCQMDDMIEHEGESYDKAAELVAEGESWCGHCCALHFTDSVEPQWAPLPREPD